MSIVSKMWNRCRNNVEASTYYRNTEFGIKGSFKVLQKKSYTNQEIKDWAIENGRFHYFPYRGDGERVAVLDSGVDAGHPDLAGQVIGQSFIDGDIDYNDNFGHGTFVAGLIVAKENQNGVVGVAPNAKAFCGKVLYGDYRDGNILIFENNLVKAINTSIEEKCGVISMSLGFYHKSVIVEEAINNAVNNGIIPFGAFGNDGLIGSPHKTYPAHYENCISVASANEKGLPTWFSSEGSEDLFKKPEISIASLEYYWGCLPNKKWGKMQGTSMACPFAAGVALLWRQAMKEKGMLPIGSDVLKEFRSWLMRVAKDTNGNGWDNELGFGILKLEDEDL
jgi:major intracellular serine protease